jgi:hypothetical protein
VDALVAPFLGGDDPVFGYLNQTLNLPDFLDATRRAEITAQLAAATMADVGERWPEFICIEAANIPETAVHLAPATSHHLTTRLALL